MWSDAFLNNTYTECLNVKLLLIYLILFCVLLTSCSMFLSFSSSATKSRDSSVGIALGYGLDDRGTRVRFPAGARNFSLHHRVQNGTGAHPASYPMGLGGLFLWG
jgi:hypothetical protein